jgi:hypothetical protein
LPVGASIGISLDADCGEVVWEFKTAGKITCGPIVAGDGMNLVSYDSKPHTVNGTGGIGRCSGTSEGW